MDAALYGVALGTFTVAAIIHYFSMFRLAALLGLIFLPACGVLLYRTMNLPTAIAVFTLFGIAPALFVLVHAIDCERGHYNLPTFYSIPLAFIAGLTLLFCCALGVIF
jgi:hypothetical protein